MHSDLSALTTPASSAGAIILVIPGNPGGLLPSISNLLSTLLSNHTSQNGSAILPAATPPVLTVATDPSQALGAETKPAVTPVDMLPVRRRRSAMTPAEKAQHIYETEGDVSLDRPTWVARTGVSRRLLDRAIRNGAIPTTRQGVGRANRRDLAKASDVAAVLATIEAVRAGKAEAPDWYDAVIRPPELKDAA